MGVITYTAASLTLRSEWEGKANPKPATIGEGVRQFEVTGIPLYATVRSAVLSFDLTGGAHGYLSNYRLCTVAGQDVSNDGGSLQSVRLEISANRTVDVVCKYQAFEYRGPIDGQTHYDTVTFGSETNPLTLTITFDEGEDTGYTDNEVMVPAKGIHLYEPTETDFAKNGIVLQPVSCTVSEEAGGEYVLDMEHPMDSEGRWQMLLEGYLIKAPVPPHKIPEVTIPVGKIWQVKDPLEAGVTQAPLYSQLPWTERSEIISVDGVKTWDSTKIYAEETHVAWQNKMWKATVNTLAGEEPGVSSKWKWLSDIGANNVIIRGGGVYHAGVVLVLLDPGSQVTFLADYDAQYVKVRDIFGNEGYILRSQIQESGVIGEPYVIPERRIYTQLFRIVEVSCDEAAHTLTVTARHKSYDFQGNALFDCQMEEAEPASAVALLQGRLMEDDDRLIACPLDRPKITAEWGFQNPVQALLDPEEGLAGILKARVERDNDDFFLLSNETARNGPRLAYGVNLMGVSWTRNTEELVTRIIPRAQKEDGYLYLDELFVDSPHKDEYPCPHIEVLDSQYSVNQKITHMDGTETTLSRSDVLERMRQEAENRYYVDGADKVTVTLDVEFILLGDTEEYRQYRNLQRVCLYDRITIDTGHTTATAQVIGYEWDCIAGRYSAISIGKVYSQARRQIPGYRMATGAVTYSKLSPGLIRWIRGET